MEQILSQDELKAIYINGPRPSRASKFEDEQWKYDVYTVVGFSSISKAYIPVSLAIKTYNDSEDQLGAIIFKQGRDYRHFGEFVFLLAAKLKYDMLLSNIPYGKAGFLHSKEIIELSEARVTKVQSTVYAAMHRLCNNAKNQQSGEGTFLQRFFIEPDQLWHLICSCGFTGGGIKDSQDLVWWLNVSPERVYFKDASGKTLKDEDLKKILSKLLPKRCLFKSSKWRDFEKRLKKHPDFRWTGVEVGTSDDAGRGRKHREVMDKPMSPPNAENIVEPDQAGTFMPLDKRLGPMPGRYPTKIDFDGGGYYRDDRVHNDVMRILNRNKRCLIVGTPGCGKTTLALAIGYDFLKDAHNTAYYQDASRGSDPNRWAKAIRAYDSNVLVILDNVHTKSEDINNLLCDIGEHKCKLLLVAREVERRFVRIMHPDDSGTLSYLDIFRQEKAIKYLKVSKVTIRNIIDRLSKSKKIKEDEIGNAKVLLKKCQGDLHILRFYLDAWERKGRCGHLSDMGEKAILDDMYYYYLKGKSYKEELVKIAALSQLEIPVDAKWITKDKDLEALQTEGLLEPELTDAVEWDRYVIWLRVYHPTPARYFLLATAYTDPGLIRSLDKFTLACLRDYLKTSPYNFFGVFRQLYVHGQQEWYSDLLSDRTLSQVAKQNLQEATPKYVMGNIWTILGFVRALMRLETSESFSSAKDLTEVLLERISVPDSEITHLGTLCWIFATTKKLDIDLKPLILVLDFGILGARVKEDEVRLATVRDFIQSIQRSGVGDKQVREFCDALDFRALGERAKEDKVGLATVRNFIGLVHKSGVGDKQVREFCDALDFRALGERAKEDKVGLGTIRHLIGSILRLGVGDKQVREFWNALDFTFLGRITCERKGSPLSIGYFIRQAIRARVQGDKISHFCDELGSDLWRHACIIQTVSAWRFDKLSKEVEDLLPRFSADVFEDLLSKASLRHISDFLRSFDGKANIIRHIIPSGIRFEILDQDLPGKMKVAKIGDVAHFLFNFYYIRRADLAHHFALKVEENAQIMTPKLGAAKSKEINLLLWNMWMSSRTERIPRFLCMPNVLSILEKKVPGKMGDLESVLGIITICNLTGNKLPSAKIPKHLEHSAKTLCLQEAEKNSYTLIALCGSDLRFSRIEKDRLIGTLESIDNPLHIPNQEIAIECLIKRLERKAE